MPAASYRLRVVIRDDPGDIETSLISKGREADLMFLWAPYLCFAFSSGEDRREANATYD